jgi:enterochelin esterase-like enzyme
MTLRHMIHFFHCWNRLRLRSAETGSRRSPALLAAVYLFMKIAAAAALAASIDDVYLLCPDSQPHDGVPKGQVIGPLTLASQVFTNTTRHYWVYVPAQYDAAKPACLMVFQDGHAFVSLEGNYRVPYVFDNLIYRREMPVTLAVFINPGHTPEQPESTSTNWGDTINNRPTEYNELNDRYATMIVNELLPALARDYNLSKNPEDRAIAGASSGAICAFTVAWQRPDQFRKVISTIGSFTNLRGGHVYPDLIRQSERKPIRIFLQDGVNDLRGRRRSGGGYDPQRDWHAQNIKMVAALTEKGYDVNYCWGIGTHSNKQGGAMLPEMLRWLWRDYARPDDPMDDSNRTLFVPVVNSSSLPGSAK